MPQIKQLFNLPRVLPALIASLAMVPVQAQSTPFPLGGYFNSPYDSQFAPVYSSFVQLMGASPRFILYNIDVQKPVSNWPGNAGYAAGAQQGGSAKTAIPVIGFPMHSYASGLSGDQDYQAFTTGQYDSYIQQVVQQYQQNGYNTQYYRIGWEMNLTSPTNPSSTDYTPSSFAGTDPATEADWVAAFQHIATTLQAAGKMYGVTVKIVWNPNVSNGDHSSTLTTLYPGDQYVDVVAADMYAGINPYSSSTDHYYDWDKNDGTQDTLAQFIADPINRIHYWNYPTANNGSLNDTDVANVSLQKLLDLAKAHGKPFALGETGAGNPDGHDVADEAAFPAWLAQKLQSSGDSIAFVNIWDANAAGNYLFSTTDANKPNEAAAWAQGFGAVQAISSTAWYTIANTNSTDCVDDSGWNKANGTQILQWNCGTQQYNQEWQFQPTDSGYYTITSRNATGSVLDVINNATADGTHVQLWQNLNGVNQQWMPVALGNGSYKLVERGSGKCLDVPYASVNAGAWLWIYTCNNTGAQSFQLTAQP